MSAPSNQTGRQAVPRLVAPQIHAGPGPHLNKYLTALSGVFAIGAVTVMTGGLTEITGYRDEQAFALGTQAERESLKPHRQGPA